MKRKVTSWLVMIVILFFVVYGGFRFYKNYIEIQKLQQEVTRLEAEISAAREEKERLQLELKNINNPEYIEKIARKELGLVKPGELLIIPVEPEKEDEDKDKDKK